MFPGPSAQSDWVTEPPIAKFFRNIDYFTRQFNFSVTIVDNSHYISPIAIHSFLSLVSDTAVSQTYRQLYKVVCCQVQENMKLHYKNLLRDFGDIGATFEVNMPRKLFIKRDYGLQSSFTPLCTENYKIELEKVSFHDIHTVAYKGNDAIGLNAVDRLERLVEPSDLRIYFRMLFVNGTWFEGSFLYPFLLPTIHRENYHLSSGDIQCDMMCTEGLFPCAKNEELRATLVQLKFSHIDFSMLLIVPIPGSTIDHTQSTLRHVSFRELVASLTLKHIFLKLPKIRLRYAIDLTEIVKQFGLDICFSSNARFPELNHEVPNPTDALRIDSILQKCGIEINEWGVNEPGTGGGRSPHLNTPPRAEESSEPETLAVDHPFLFAFFLYEQDGYHCPLAIGKVNHPRKEGLVDYEYPR